MNLVQFLWRALARAELTTVLSPSVECCICLDDVPPVLDDSLLTPSERYGGASPRASLSPVARPASPTTETFQSTATKTSSRKSKSASPHQASTSSSPPASSCSSPTPTPDAREAANETARPATFTRLKSCQHCFCTSCIQRYVQLKVQSHELERDQLVCPQTECRKPLGLEDLQKLLQRDGFVKYQQLLQRKRDEQNPNARWCVNKTCGELIVCANDQVDTFECAKCQSVGCFACGKPAHSKWTKWYVCDQHKLDSSYLHWEKSVGSSQAVRGCPQCQIRIWKNEGCNHMTCSHCRHEFCWVCRDSWSPRHYRCRDHNDNHDTNAMQGVAGDLRMNRFWLNRLHQQRIKAVVIGAAWFTLLVVVVVFVGVVGFLVYLVMCVLDLVKDPKRRCASRRKHPAKQNESPTAQGVSRAYDRTRLG